MKTCWVLLLSGGAFKGAVQLATISKLINEHGCLPDEIRGTSVGAVNGVMVAQDRLDELNEIWNLLDDSNPIFGVKGFLKSTPFAKEGFWSLDPLRDEMIKNHVTFDRLKTRFGAGIYIPERDLHIVPTWSSDGCIGHSIPLQAGVLASTAILGMFHGIKIRWEKKYSIAADGGHEHVLPPAPDWILPGDHVDAIFCAPVESDIMIRTQEQVNGRLKRLAAGIDKGMHAPARGDFETLKALSRSGINVRVFAPQQDPGSMLDASRKIIKLRRSIGEEMAIAPIFDSKRM